MAPTLIEGGTLGQGRSGRRVVLMEEDYTSSSAATLRTLSSAPHAMGVDFHWTLAVGHAR